MILKFTQKSLKHAWIVIIVFALIFSCKTSTKEESKEDAKEAFQSFLNGAVLSTFEYNFQ